jgi:formylglycine-generating enzyme required for sulfatase activity
VPTRALLERYVKDPATGRRLATPVGPLSPDASTSELAPGSYRLVLEGEGLARVVYPFEIGRGQRLAVDLALPAASSVPPGFVYIAPGEFWYGDVDEELRTGFLETVPIHRRRTEAFLIARHETTYADWIAFLEALPDSEVKALEPRVTGEVRGSLSLESIPSGKASRRWQLAIQPGSQRYVVRQGEGLVYEGRVRNQRQDWTQMPVGGVSPRDIERYTAWLRSTGAVPGARLCTDVEWERAARGADDRVFPHGDRLLPGDANFDRTYGRVDAAYGPDAVGSFPAGRSPFEVDDLAGNVFELVSSSPNGAEFALRGGAYFYAAYTLRLTNREPVPPTVRGGAVGVRVCASVVPAAR